MRSAGGVGPRRFPIVLLAIVCAAWSPGTALAQPGRGNPAEPAIDEPLGVSPGELQRLFDAYALMQAQQTLQLRDDQYPSFLTRLKALQEVRRRYLADRARALQDLRRLVQGVQGSTDDDRIRDRLRVLREINERGLMEIARALEELDQTLDPAQQARLRLFEEQMDRRKLELLMRARQRGRGRLRP